MMQEILINWTPQETRVAIIENKAVQELYIERALDRSVVGNIYLGKVTRVLPGMQSAFVDIGLPKAAFLHVADMITHIHQRHEAIDAEASFASIEQLVFEGQTLLVQVLKEPLGTKGARLTTQISLPGRFLVFMPQDNHIGVSQKIAATARTALLERVQILSQQVHQETRLPLGGYIVRTNAQEATETELAQDMRYLLQSWQQIQQATATQPAKTLVHTDLTLSERVLRDFVNETSQRVQIDDKAHFDYLQQKCALLMPQAFRRLAHYQASKPIFDLFGIDLEIEKALARRVDLPSGGYLVFDQTEALTTVDVNTGGFVGRRNFEETLLKTNLQACAAIARQLRLRNLGGIIIVDFIDMQSTQHQDKVLQELTLQLAKDRVKTVVGGFSALGLVEMTRKRTRESLSQLLCEPCRACQGRGYVKTAQTVAHEVIRAMQREADQLNLKSVRVMVAPQVAALLLDEASSQSLALWIAELGKPVNIQSDANLGPEQFDVVFS